jgi:hypothetical protein
MSPSDADQVRLKADTASVVSQLEQFVDRTDLSPEDVRAIVSAVTRLYANACTRAGVELPPVTSSVSTTDAITLSCALLRSQDLTPFEMAMWFGRGARQE